MRVDKPQTQNTFNVVLIVFFFIGSSNILSLIFWRSNPIMYGNNIQDTITKYELCEEKNRVVNSNNWHNMDTESLLTTSYMQKEALKVFNISDQQGKKYIKNNRKFWKNGVYNHGMFLSHLQHIQQISKTRITEQDYLAYAKIHVASLMFQKMRIRGMYSMKIGENIAGNIDARKQKVTLIGYKVVVQNSLSNEKEFTKKEIEEFIRKQVRNRIRYYLDVENISGNMLTVKLGLTSTNVMEAVNFFLKQEVFNKENLLSFMEQVALDSENFDKSVDYQKVLVKWKKNNRRAEKSVNLTPFFEIEELDKIEEVDDNGYIFNIKHAIHKGFTVVQGSYKRFITKEHNKEKQKKLTESDIQDYVLPTMRLARKKENQIKNAYNMTYAHNDGSSPIKINKNTLEMKIANPMFKFDTDMKNQALVFFDNTGYPYIFIVQKVQVEGEGRTIDIQLQLATELNKILDRFIDYDLYKYLFGVYYNKIRNQYQA